MKVDSFVGKHIQDGIREYCNFIHEANMIEISRPLTIIQNYNEINVYTLEYTDFFIIVIPLFDEGNQEIVDNFWLFHKQYIPTIGMFGLEKESYNVQAIIGGKSLEYMEWYK